MNIEYWWSGTDLGIPKCSEQNLPKW